METTAVSVSCCFGGLERERGVAGERGRGGGGAGRASGANDGKIVLSLPDRPPKPSAYDKSNKNNNQSINKTKISHLAPVAAHLPLPLKVARVAAPPALKLLGAVALVHVHGDAGL
jgi:hypothetical protein